MCLKLDDVLDCYSIQISLDVLKVTGSLKTQYLKYAGNYLLQLFKLGKNTDLNEGVCFLKN